MEPITQPAVEPVTRPAAEPGFDVVTGAFSFTGRHIARRLLAQERRVRTLTRRPQPPGTEDIKVDIAPLQFADRAALVESLRTRYRADLTMDDVLRLAADGDVGCRRALADAGRLLGVQVANLCNLLNPRLVIIAGKLSEADEIVLEPLRTSFARHALPHAAETVEIVRAVIGDRATALGAAALAMHESGALTDVGSGRPHPVERPPPTERRSASPSWGTA